MVYRPKLFIVLILLNIYVMYITALPGDRVTFDHICVVRVHLPAHADQGNFCRLHYVTRERTLNVLNKEEHNVILLHSRVHKLTLVIESNERTNPLCYLFDLTQICCDKNSDSCAACN